MEEKKELNKEQSSCTNKELPMVSFERTILVNALTTEQIKFVAKGLTSNEALTNLANTIGVFIEFENARDVKESKRNEDKE